MFTKRCLFRSAFSLLMALHVLGGQPSFAVQEWNNSATGAGAGNWFSAANWSPNGIPNSTQAASINNSGEAQATAGGPITALQIDVGKNGGLGMLTTSNVNFEVATSLDVGDVEATFAVGNVNFVSDGTATITDASSLEFGLSGVGDVNVGQTSAGLGATAEGMGQLTVERIGDWQLAGDLDVGQTSGNGTATGMGTAVIRDITGALGMTGDLDVGQTSGTAGSLNSGHGTLTLEDVAQLQIGADLDVGQSTGEGQSSAVADAFVSNANVTIGDSLDVAKVRALNSAFNSSTATTTVFESDMSVGFGAANLGSIEIARVLTTESARGVGIGTLTLDQVDALVANDVIIGELALGGINSNSSANGTLRMIDSRVDTRDLSVGVRLDGTAGSVTGRLEMRSSLMIVQSLMTLSPTSTLQLTVAGTTRALGDGLDAEYAAIDADMASLAGVLAIDSTNDYAGPATPGDVETFELINTLFGIGGSFDQTSYDGVELDSGPTYVGAANSSLDGLFAEVTQTATQVLLTTYLALPGDANGDRTVDGTDFLIWNNNKFTSDNNWSTGDFTGDGITDGSDFLIWNTNKFTSADEVNTVPEPASWSMLFCVVVFGLFQRRTLRANLIHTDIVA